MYEIRLDGPGKNALNTAMMTSIEQRLADAGGDAVLLTGAGDCFCAGLDLRELAALDAAGMERFLRQLDRLVAALYLHPAPVVAALNGHAIAGGCILGLCADYRVLSRAPKTRVGLNEVAIGLRFPLRILSLVRARVSPAHLDAVVLGAALVDPPTALAQGLVDELSDDPVATATARLDALCKHPRAGYAGAKRDLRGEVMALTDAVERRFVTEALPAWTDPSVRQRILSVLKK